MTATVALQRGRIRPPRRAWAPMLRAMNRLARAAGLATLVALGAACGSSSNAPPPDAGLRDADATRAPTDGDAREGGPAERSDVATTTAAPNACAPGAAWFDLLHRSPPPPTAAPTASSCCGPESEHAIYVLDPDTCATTRIAVPRLPISIALSPSQQDLAVGHDGMVSIFDLTSGSPRAKISVPAPATELAYDAAGRILVFSRALASIATQLLVVDPVAGTATAVGALEGGGHLRGTADGTERVLDGRRSDDRRCHGARRRGPRAAARRRARRAEVVPRPVPDRRRAPARHGVRHRARRLRRRDRPRDRGRPRGRDEPPARRHARRQGPHGRHPRGRRVHGGAAARRHGAHPRDERSLVQGRSRAADPQHGPRAPDAARTLRLPARGRRARLRGRPPPAGPVARRRHRPPRSRARRHERRR